MRVLMMRFLISVIVTSLVAISANAAIKKVATKNTAQKVIVVFGDSLSAGYGLPANAGWVALLQARITQQKRPYQIINASISGETTSGGLSRFSQMLVEHKPHIVILELGANDGLRGLNLSDIESNLDKIMTQAKAAKAQVLLLGMKIPPNYGKKYSLGFSKNYQTLAKQQQTKLVPFLLEGVAGKPSLMQEDGLHPLAIAQPVLLNNVWKVLEKML